MAPIPTNANPGEKRLLPSGTSAERKSELVTRIKYCNTLPDLPFDPKFISYPYEPTRFVKYSTTSLERNYVYEVLTEPDLGVEVELVVPNAYNIPMGQTIPPLEPVDEKLLEEEVLPQKDQKRSLHHAKPVSWLRRTEYISTEQTRFQPQTIDKVEAKVGFSIKKMLKDEIHFLDHDSQIIAIEKTFEDSAKPIETHFSKPGVYPVEVLPIFPDFNLWKYPCAQVIFDSDPAPVGRPMPAQLEEMSQAMIRGVMDDSGEQFVAYFLPTEETLEKRKRDETNGVEYDEDDTYEYKMAREYNWNVKTKATKGYEETYFFVIREDGVYYNELETRVRLNKRRTRGPNQQLNTKLCVKHIGLTQAEYKFQRNRERDLEPLQEEEEEEDEEEEKEKEGSGSEAEEKSDAEGGGDSEDKVKIKKEKLEKKEKVDEEEKKAKDEDEEMEEDDGEEVVKKKKVKIVDDDDDEEMEHQENEKSSDEEEKTTETEKVDKTNENDEGEKEKKDNDDASDDDDASSSSSRSSSSSSSSSNSANSD